MALQLAHDLAAVSGRRISRQTVYKYLTETRTQHSICDELKCTRKVFIWRKNETRFHSFYITKIDRFGDK
ncbi:hypothetical protein TNCV_4456351 [Trichonephila clavipes]|nr:hypothetical protein TNCV_4456351 [Trichonephila clavipes]